VESALSKVNWYWVRLTVIVEREILHGLHVQGDAATSAVSICSRRMASATFVLRSPRGFKCSEKRPLFRVTLLPSTPDEGR